MSYDRKEHFEEPAAQVIRASKPPLPASTLLACPFCGDTNVKVEWEPCMPLGEDDTNRNWFVECQKCGAQGSCSNREDRARQYWNQRADELAAIGARWKSNSSLENWFPLTAERLKFLEDARARMLGQTNK